MIQKYSNFKQSGKVFESDDPMQYFSNVDEVGETPKMFYFEYMQKVDAWKDYITKKVKNLPKSFKLFFNGVDSKFLYFGFQYSTKGQDTEQIIELLDEFLNGGTFNVLSAFVKDKNGNLADLIRANFSINYFQKI
jgi:hypothetical protein